MQEVPHRRTHKANIILTISGHELLFILLDFMVQMIMGFKVAWWIYLPGCEYTHSSWQKTPFCMHSRMY